jgi:cyclohexadieny/prephenate dehydrogenase
MIPGHPIAGTEQSGPDAGFPTLFQGAWHILTPVETGAAGEAEALAQLTAFWKGLGAKVESMDAARHDRVLAITSHLPHLIAFNIVATAFDMETVEQGEVVKYSAGGFRDFTRIAASDPVMWRDVFLNNREAVLECLGRFSEDLAALQRAIRWGDGDMLMREFTRARTIRKAIIDAGQDSGAVNFGRNVPKAEE